MSDLDSVLITEPKGNFVAIDDDGVVHDSLRSSGFDGIVLNSSQVDYT